LKVNESRSESKVLGWPFPERIEFEGEIGELADALEDEVRLNDEAVPPSLTDHFPLFDS
jgi:hypothetical protein